MRAWATVIQRDLQVEAVIADLYAGRPVAYTTFLAYDEVAHHSGIERPDDARDAAARRSPDRPHRRGAPPTPRGPTGSWCSPTTASRRARRSSTATASRLEDARPRGGRRRAASSADGHRRRGARLPGRVAHRGLGGRLGAGASALRRLTRRRTVDGAVQLGAGDGGEASRAPAARPPEIVVMASGCLGLVSFPREPGRVTLERLEERYPRVLADAAPSTRASGSCSCARRAHGALVLGAARRALPRRGPRRGRGPAGAVRPARRAPRQPHRRLPALPRHRRQQHLLAAHSTRSRPSRSSSARTAAWAARSRSRSCCTRPTSSAPAEELVGAEAVHRQLRRWLVGLGHEQYADAVASPGAAGG